MFQVKTKSSLHPTAKVKTRVPWIPPGKVSTRETSYKWEVSQILQIHSYLCLCTIHVKYCTLCRKENLLILLDVFIFMYILGAISSSGDNTSTGTRTFPVSSPNRRSLHGWRRGTAWTHQSVREEDRQPNDRGQLSEKWGEKYEIGEMFQGQFYCQSFLSVKLYPRNYSFTN